MSDAVSGARFEAIDPRLNVFALANGMDLAKDAESRRLEWFSDGLERGIVIRADGESGFAIDVVAWRTRTTEVTNQRELATRVEAGSISAVLSDAIDAANGL